MRIALVIQYRCTTLDSLSLRGLRLRLFPSEDVRKLTLIVPLLVVLVVFHILILCADPSDACLRLVRSLASLPSVCGLLDRLEMALDRPRREHGTILVGVKHLVFQVGWLEHWFLGIFGKPC